MRTSETAKKIDESLHNIVETIDRYIRSTWGNEILPERIRLFEIMPNNLPRWKNLDHRSHTTNTPTDISLSDELQDQRHAHSKESTLPTASELNFRKSL